MNFFMCIIFVHTEKSKEGLKKIYQRKQISSIELNRREVEVHTTEEMKYLVIFIQ